MNWSKLFRLSLIMGLVTLAVSTTGFAQLKIRFINTDRVLAEYPEAQDIQKKLDDLKSGYETEFQKMQQDYQKLGEDIQNQSLLLSPDKKAEKEANLQALQNQMEKYYYDKLGPQGEYFQKNKELTEPLINKINQVIKKIGEDEGYDYILDVVQGVVLYARPEYDITQKVLDELSKLQ